MLLADYTQAVEWGISNDFLHSAKVRMLGFGAKKCPYMFKKLFIMFMESSLLRTIYSWTVTVFSNINRGLKMIISINFPLGIEKSTPI